MDEDNDGCENEGICMMKEMIMVMIIISMILMTKRVMMQCMIIVVIIVSYYDDKDTEIKMIEVKTMIIMVIMRRTKI